MQTDVRLDCALTAIEHSQRWSLPTFRGGDNPTVIYVAYHLISRDGCPNARLPPYGPASWLIRHGAAICHMRVGYLSHSPTMLFKGIYQSTEIAKPKYRDICTYHGI